MRTLTMTTLGLIGLVLLAVTAHTGAVAQGKDGGGRLAGTWEAVVTVRNCATGNAITSFQSTAAFQQGGTFNGITGGTAPALRSPEAGVWNHVSGNLYRFRFKAYLFNAAGVAVGYQVITHNLELDADAASYSSEGISEIFAMDGTPGATGCSTSTATRMAID